MLPRWEMPHPGERWLDLLQKIPREPGSSERRSRREAACRAAFSCPPEMFSLDGGGHPKILLNAQCGPGQLSGLTRFEVGKVLSWSPMGSWGGDAPGDTDGAWERALFWLVFPQFCCLCITHPPLSPLVLAFWVPMCPNVPCK